MTEGTRVAALVVVTDENNRCLLVRSAKRSDRWELPGGIVESGESPMAAAVREVREETGLAIHSLGLVGLYHGSGDGLLRIAFKSVIPAQEPRYTNRFAGEILEARWYRRSELPSPMPVLARTMIESARAGRVDLVSIEDDSRQI